MNLLRRVLGIKEKGAASEPKRVFGMTDVGMTRTNNEDYFLISPAKRLYIVADGMGGHSAGEVASLNAVEAVNDYLAPELLARVEAGGEALEAEMKTALRQANRKVLAMAEADAAYRGMGCTLVAAMIAGSDLHVCHVGDARAYVSGGKGIRALTTDHSKVMDLVRAGQMQPEEARKSPLKNELSQAIGMPGEVAPDHTRHAIGDKDKILLCSDGLWDMLSDEAIHEILRQEKPAKALCEALVSAANQAGGHDNITVVVILPDKREITPESGLQATDGKATIKRA